MLQGSAGGNADIILRDYVSPLSTSKCTPNSSETLNSVESAVTPTLGEKAAAQNSVLESLSDPLLVSVVLSRELGCVIFPEKRLGQKGIPQLPAKI